MKALMEFKIFDFVNLHLKISNDYVIVLGPFNAPVSVVWESWTIYSL